MSGRMLRWELLRVMWRALMEGRRTRLRTFRRSRESSVRRWWRALGLRILILPWRLVPWWAWCSRRSLLLWRHSVSVIEWVKRLWLHLRVLQLSRTAAVPVVAGGKRWRSGSRWRVLGMSTPLRPWRASDSAGRLVGLRMYVLWQRCTCLVGQSVGRLAFQ